MKDEEELEFLSVDALEDGDMSSSYGYGRADIDGSGGDNGNGGVNNSMGNWIFNQSKVSFSTHTYVSINELYIH